MTWTWEIDGLGTAEQTLTVWNDSGSKVASETREGWSWSGDYPDFVETTVGNNDFQALYLDDIERMD